MKNQCDNEDAWERLSEPAKCAVIQRELICTGLSEFRYAMVQMIRMKRFWENNWNEQCSVDSYAVQYSIRVLLEKATILLQDIIKYDTKQLQVWKQIAHFHGDDAKVTNIIQVDNGVLCSVDFEIQFIDILQSELNDIEGLYNRMLTTSNALVNGIDIVKLNTIKNRASKMDKDKTMYSDIVSNFTSKYIDYIIRIVVFQVYRSVQDIVKFRDTIVAHSDFKVWKSNFIKNRNSKMGIKFDYSMSETNSILESQQFDSKYVKALIDCCVIMYIMSRQQCTFNDLAETTPSKLGIFGEMTLVLKQANNSYILDTYWNMQKAKQNQEKVDSIASSRSISAEQIKLSFGKYSITVKKDDNTLIGFNIARE